jgi:hypothetical protein
MDLDYDKSTCNLAIGDQQLFLHSQKPNPNHLGVGSGRRGRVEKKEGVGAGRGRARDWGERES